MAQQALGNVRTVAAFGQEGAMLEQYEAALESTTKVLCFDA